MLWRCHWLLPCWWWIAWKCTVSRRVVWDFKFCKVKFEWCEPTCLPSLRVLCEIVMVTSRKGAALFLRHTRSLLDIALLFGGLCPSWPAPWRGRNATDKWVKFGFILPLELYEQPTFSSFGLGCCWGLCQLHFQVNSSSNSATHS